LQPIKSTLDQHSTNHYSGLLNQLVDQARAMFRETDPANGEKNVNFLREKIDGLHTLGTYIVDISNLGIFLRTLEWKMLVFVGPFGIFCVSWVYFVAIWYILCSFGIFLVIWYILWQSGIFCGNLVYFVAIWYILLSFGIFSPVLV
jgi:hypothetical protein